MKKWRITLCCVVLCFWQGENSRGHELSLLPGNNMLSIVIPEFLGQSPTTPPTGTTVPDISKVVATESSISSLEQDQVLSSSLEMTNLETLPTSNDTSDLIDLRYPVLHAGLPRDLTVTPLLREHGDHELVFNVSWTPSLGPQARDYSLEVTSETETEDCRSPICYEYDIPGDFHWYVIPKLNIVVAETCAIRPGCAYAVRLIAHPWDGHTSANKHVQLNECVAGVCSCAHAPRLPAPIVQAHTFAVQGQIKANISWTLPSPHSPRRLPPNLQKQYYFVSIGKQMVSDAHPSPWFAYIVQRRITVGGPVAIGDDVRWSIVNIDGRSDGRGGERDKKQRGVPPDVKLLARVSLVDDRGCVGPAGNATAFDPAQTHKIRIGTYALWAAFGGACVLAMVAILCVSARVMKRVLRALHPAPVPAPLETLSRRPAWFPMQLCSTTRKENKRSVRGFRNVKMT